MKKLLILFLSMSLWGCEISRTKEFINETDVGFLRGKTIYQVLPSSDGDEVNILFTDSTAINISTAGGCYLLMKKQ